MLTEATEMTDLSEHFEHFSRVICAHGRGKNMLIMRKLRNPYKRSDGLRVSYEIEYRWLSRDLASPPTDEYPTEAWACVMGYEFSYWSLREIKETGFDIDNPTNLFDHFSLC